MTRHAHNSGNVEWFTPSCFVEAARETMGGIDLDPASSAEANVHVKAARYFDRATDGLTQEWAGRVWLNPPYQQPLIRLFVEKLLASPSVDQAVVLTNNGTETRWAQALIGASSAMCFPRGRIRFLRADGSPAKQPLQGQMICYVGPAASRFCETFSDLGCTRF